MTEAKPLPRLPKAELDAFIDAPTSVISDCLDRLPALAGLRPYNNGAQMIGQALTVLTRSGDNLAFHRALEITQPGDVLVVDAGGSADRAITGEIMKAIAESRGAVGFVINGAIRDSAAFAASSFGCYATGVIHRGPYKNGPGEVNVPVSIGGWTVNPGDIVIGDADGVVTFPAAKAAELIKAVRAKMAQEAETLKAIAEGRYKGSYGR